MGKLMEASHRYGRTCGMPRNSIGGFRVEPGPAIHSMDTRTHSLLGQGTPPLPLHLPRTQNRAGCPLPGGRARRSPSRPYAETIATCALGAFPEPPGLPRFSRTRAQLTSESCPFLCHGDQGSRAGVRPITLPRTLVATCTCIYQCTTPGFLHLAGRCFVLAGHALEVLDCASCPAHLRLSLIITCRSPELPQRTLFVHAGKPEKWTVGCRWPWLSPSAMDGGSSSCPDRQRGQPDRHVREG